MRKKFLVKREMKTFSPTNSPIITWKPHLNVYGAIDLLQGSTVIKYGKITPTSTHILICDVADIKESDRVYFNKRVFKVNFVDNPMELNHHLEIELEYLGSELEVDGNV